MKCVQICATYYSPITILSAVHLQLSTCTLISLLISKIFIAKSIKILYYI